ncbi:MAG: NAD(P)H-binding protein [Streptosporangiales bacterium]|nr:NAD(P)H-binding protein [Streptosporangiales bacterium]
MKIVVTTPTGHVGSRVVRLLCQAGVRPVLAMRHPDRLDAQTRAHVDVVVADQDDAESVVRATKGADALFWVDPPGTDDDPVAGFARLGAHAARAVAENGIGRTVFVSSVGAEKRDGAGEIDGLARTEELLNETGASVVHLRCGYFFTNLLLDVDSLREGVLRTTMPLDVALPWVDPRDIGDVAVARLLSADWSGRHVQAVHGLEDHTFAQVAAITGEAIGRPVRAETISDDTLRNALRAIGMGDLQVEGIVGMSAGLRDDFAPENERTVLTTTPTPLASWAYSHLRPAF